MNRYTATQTALPVFVSTNCTINKSCTQKYNLLLLLLLLYASMFVNTGPIYADVFSIFYHSLQLSCGRNNTKMARANYDICTVLRYCCFHCYLYKYIFSYTNSSYLFVKLLHSVFLHTAPTSANVFSIFRYRSIQSSGCFFNMAAMKSVRIETW